MSHIEANLGTEIQVISHIRRIFHCIKLLCANTSSLGLQSGEGSSREDSCMTSTKSR